MATVGVDDSSPTGRLAAEVSCLGLRVGSRVVNFPEISGNIS